MSTITNPGRRILSRNPDATDLIDLRMPFQNRTGSFTGEEITLPEGEAAAYVHAPHHVAIGEAGLVEVGNLPYEFAAMLAGQITAGAGRTLYLVRSYGGIIAWSFDGPSVTPYHGPNGTPGTVTVPNVRHSQTTSGHQHVVARAIGARWIEVTG